MPDKLPINAAITLNAHNIIMDAIERGIAYGYTRAHKHTDKPTREQMEENIRAGIAIELAEVVEWGE